MSAITDFLIAHGGLILLLVGFAEQSGMPFPGAPWLLAAGALAASGSLNLLAAIGGAAVGCMAADLIWFYVGHRESGRILRTFARWEAAGPTVYPRIRPRSILHGVWILTTAKFLPLGTVIPLRAGALEIGLVRFVLADAFSSVVYAATYVLLGFIFRNELKQVVAFMKKLGAGSLLLIVTLAGTYIAYRFLHRRPKRGGDIIHREATVEDTPVARARIRRALPGHFRSRTLRARGRPPSLTTEPVGLELPV